MDLRFPYLAQRLRQLIFFVTSQIGLGSGITCSNSFEFVDPQPQPLSSVPVGETRDQIEASFPACPSLWFGKAKRLCGSALTGLWAAAVLQGRIATLNRSSTLDLRSRFYAVLRADRLREKTLILSAHSYFQAVGDLKTSTSIFHAFPSELEATIFFDAAGVDHFEKEQ